MSYCDAIAGYPNSKANPHNSNNGTHASDCAHDCSLMKYYCRVLQQKKGPTQKGSFTTDSKQLQDTPAAKLTYASAMTVPAPPTALILAVTTKCYCRVLQQERGLIQKRSFTKAGCHCRIHLQPG